MLTYDILQGIGIALEVLTFVVLIRVLISWIPGINQFHPLVRVLRAIADPILAPFRGLLPSFGGMLDLSPVLAIVVLQVLASVCFSLSYNSLGGASLWAIIASAGEQLVLTLIILVAVLVLLRFVLSLFHADPWHPMTRAIRAMARPFLIPFSGLVSRSSSLDMEALVAFIAYLVLFLVARFALDWLVSLI